MEVETEDKGNVLVIKLLTPRLDASSAVKFSSLLDKAMGDGRYQLLVDMAEIQFIDSSGLGAMTSGKKKVGDKGRIAFCGLQQQPRRMLALTRMDRIFNLHDDREAALGSFS